MSFSRNKQADRSSAYHEAYKKAIQEGSDQEEAKEKAIAAACLVSSSPRFSGLLNNKAFQWNEAVIDGSTVDEQLLRLLN